MDNPDFMEYMYKELYKADEILGDINLISSCNLNAEFKKVHSSYNIIHALKNKVRFRIEKEKSIIKEDE